MGLDFQDHLALEKDRYQINKLICVNSMKNICYLELDVTCNTVLYGDNNLGKTSILSTLKLHLLPEINFRDSKHKFAFFGSSGKAYNNQESRDFYFPSINSFLILEGQNPFGPYVYILFRASDEQFGYSRVVLPVSYAEIEHEFWDKNTASNHQLGGINNQLSLKRVKSLVKQYGGRLLRTTQEIRETIYTFNQLNEEKGRFCIIPMKEGGIGREIEAFRRLLQFTFEINQGSPASLTSALATIIEGQKKSKKDELEQNLHAIIDEYKELNTEQEKITCLKNTVDYYQRIKKSYANAQQGLDVASALYWQIKQSLSEQQQVLAEQEEQIHPEYELLIHEILPDEKEKLQRFKDQKQALKSACDQLIGYLKPEEKKVKRIKFLLEDEFAFVEQNEIEELLQEAKEQLQADLDSLASEASFAEELQNKISRKKTLEKRLVQLEQQLENGENSLLYQVSSQAASVLKTINPNFDQLNSDNAGEFLESDIQRINAFCELFEAKNEHLFFKAQDFIQPVVEFDPQQQQLKWQQDKNQVEKELNRLKHRIEQDSGEYHKLTPESLAAQKLEKQNELKQTNDDLALIINRDKINQDFQDNSLQLEQQQEQLEALQRELDACKEQLDIYQAQKQQLKQQVEALKTQKTTFLQMDNQLKRYKGYETQFNPAENIESLELDNELMLDLEKQVDLFLYALRQTEQTIHDLVFKEKLEFLDIESVYRQDKSIAELGPLVEQLSAEYDNIESYEKHLQVLVRKHNKIVGTKVSELEQNNQLISDFRRKLDASFKGIRISDLDEIHVKLKLDPRFDELLADIQSENVDFYHDNLISADFYDKLNAFCGQFFVSLNGKSETLTLEGLIKEVLYEYRIEGQEHRTTSSQSNGTNAIINSTFLTILLKELIQPNIILALPVVFDEIANLDYQNMLSVVEVVKNNHFSLFSATPTENLQLNNALGNFINLDLFKAVEQSYDENRAIVYYGGAESLETLETPIEVMD